MSKVCALLIALMATVTTCAPLLCSSLNDVGNCIDGDRFGIRGGCVWHYDAWEKSNNGTCVPKKTCNQRDAMHCEYQNTDGENYVSFDCSSELCMWNGTTCEDSSKCVKASSKSKEACLETDKACTWNCVPIVPPYGLPPTSLAITEQLPGNFVLDKDNKCSCSIGFGCKYGCAAHGVKSGTKTCPVPPDVNLKPYKR